MLANSLGFRPARFRNLNRVEAVASEFENLVELKFWAVGPKGVRGPGDGASGGDFRDFHFSVVLLTFRVPLGRVLGLFPSTVLTCHRSLFVSTINSIFFHEASTTAPQFGHCRTRRRRMRKSPIKVGTSRAKNSGSIKPPSMTAPVPASGLFAL